MHKDLDFKDKKVTVMGLGLSGGGLGAATWLLQQGALVTVTDLRQPEELNKSIKELNKLGINYKGIFGKHREEDFKDADLVIKNPAVPSESSFLAIAKEAGVRVDTAIGIFISQFPGKVIGITGTKGKTTTTTLLHQIIKTSGKETILGGNIRKSPLLELGKANKNTIAVLELSSFQLENFNEHKFSPHIAIWTNLYEDHLDRYKNMKEYAGAKANIYLYQSKNDIFITNADQPEMLSHAEKAFGKVIYFSASKPLQNGFSVIENQIVYKKVGESINYGTLENLKIRGAHNVANILAAIAGAAMLGIETDHIKEVVENFKGVENRLEEVRTVNGVKFINDTASTIPISTIAALNSMTDPTILIAGGSEKNLPFDEMSKTILEKVKKLILLDDEASYRIQKNLEDIDLKKSKKILVANKYKSMDDAVKSAFSLASPKDTVLLSPGAASFGLFKNEFDRGDKFTEAVLSL